MSTNAPQAPARKGSAAGLGWLLSIGFNVVAPIVIYNQLHAHGVGDFTALLLSGLGPVLDIAVYLAWHRRVDEFAIVSLVFVALTAVVSLVGPHDARLLLVKDSFVTGLFGVLCLVSLAAPRPLMFYFGRKFATDGTAAAAAWWNGLWVHPGFRRIQRNLTIGWGVGYLAEAALRIALVYTLSTGAMVTVNNVLPYAVTGGLVLWTITYAKRAQARDAAAAAARAAAPAEPQTV
ncbi:VC0807 family protein [Kitasatospora mediocidica]|uniref:VC0807 family protein n=1 Tax=Kitasatospora mediocidica TaxID=58352 RepID=UPI00056AA954|nr:VC0807 family protein [Kitasatospora mediocidica]